MHVSEGRLPFQGMETYYRITTASADAPLIGPGVRPLVVVHGGPGCTHHYLLTLTDLVTEKRPVIHYDQVGNGASTHRPDVPVDFWTIDLFLAELHNLLEGLGVGLDYDLLGQSWGGILSSEFAVRRPAGLRRLVIADSPASMPLWRAAAAELRLELPQETQDVLLAHETAGTVHSAEYKAASDVFYARHVCRVVPNPPEVARTFEWVSEDPTVYEAMNGPTEFHVIGSLREWSVVDRLHLVEVETLVLNGRFDEATDDTVQPFVDRIPDVTWHRFENSSHMPHVEEREEYMAVVDQFLSAD